MKKPIPQVRIWFSHLYKCQFLRVPKTGSTTVVNWLNIPVASKWSYDAKEGNRYPDYPLFCTIRNPYERVISSYYETIRRRTWVENFDYYMREVEARNWFDEHMVPQSWYINQAEEYNFIFDKMILTENLQRDVSNYLKEDFPEAWYNKTAYKKEVLSGYQKLVIDVVYYDDIQLYKRIKKKKEKGL